jgi:hypothetical protein
LIFVDRDGCQDLTYLADLPKTAIGTVTVKQELQGIADCLLALRGVELGKLVLANSGKDLKPHKH